MKREQRKAWRNSMALDVICNGAGQSTQQRISDISVKGAYIATPAPLAVGSSVKIAFALPNGYVIKTEASVVRSYPKTGMGVKFTTLTEDDSERIRRFIHA